MAVTVTVALGVVKVSEEATRPFVRRLVDKTVMSAVLALSSHVSFLPCRSQSCCRATHVFAKFGECKSRLVGKAKHATQAGAWCTPVCGYQFIRVSRSRVKICAGASAASVRAGTVVRMLPFKKTGDDDSVNTDWVQREHSASGMGLLSAPADA